MFPECSLNCCGASFYQQAEFAGGVLLCGGMVTVRKDTGTQQLVLEGALSEDYYKIRQILYSQYHIL
jgi:cleavage and polyadenylation specificity factor subunit 2